MLGRKQYSPNAKKWKSPPAQPAMRPDLVDLVFELWIDQASEQTAVQRIRAVALNDTEIKQAVEKYRLAVLGVTL